MRAVALFLLFKCFIHDGHAEFSKHYRVPAEFQAIEVDGSRLAPEVETNLYRIAQEALNNLMKHAGADRVGVLLERVDGHISIIVEDDGEGFEPGEAADWERGLGLLSMKEPAAHISGTLEIESEPGLAAYPFQHRASPNSFIWLGIPGALSVFDSKRF